MERILVIGCPGSGKSTFSRELQEITGLPLHHLDLLYWNSDRTIVAKEVFLERLRAVLKEPCWIIDGNYASSMELRLQRADTVFFLDYPTELCLTGVEDRRGKPRPDLPQIERVDGEPDDEFLEMIRGFSKSHRGRILELMERYPEKTWIVFQDRAQAAAHLHQMRTK